MSIGIVLVIAILAVCIVDKIERIHNTPKPVCDCKDAYLGVCFDNSSKFYMADMVNHESNIDTWNAAVALRFLEENNIQIWGRSDCYWCNEQLKEFGQFRNYTESSQIFLDCSKNDCPGLMATPSWVKGNKIIYVSFIPAEEIPETLTYAMNNQKA